MVIKMKSKKTNTKLYEFIKEKYNFNEPILLQDVYVSFPEINKNTVRSILKRLNENEKVIKIKDGVYALPNPNSIMGKPTVYTSEIGRAHV